MISILFGWPNGICTGNLIASAIWALPVFIWLHLLRRMIRRIHRATVEAPGAGPATERSGQPGSPGDDELQPPTGRP
jgi:hypothetical protein